MDMNETEKFLNLDMVFSKKKYIEIFGEKDYLRDQAWVDVCDGKTVINKKVYTYLPCNKDKIISFMVEKDWTVPRSEWSNYNNIEKTDYSNNPLPEYFENLF
jgi:hypothetical protein